MALTGDNQVAMVKQYRKPFDEICTELPAGKLKVTDKNPLEAIKQKLKEETESSEDDRGNRYRGGAKGDRRPGKRAGSGAGEDGREVQRD